MSDQSDISVFRYKGGSSDKIWAIDKTKNQAGTYTVWFGRTGSKLNTKNVPADQSPDSRINEKLNKGYVALPGKTVHTDSREVVQVTNPAPSNAIPTALWYRVNQPSHFEEILERIDAIECILRNEWPQELSVLQSLSLYQDLKRKVKCSSHEFNGGPLGVLLLFSIRRFFNEQSNESGMTGLIDIADDFNTLLPDCFDDLNNYIADSCRSYFELMGFMSNGDHLNDVARDQGYEHYTSVKTIKQLAIAMGCIDAPIDLSAIRPDLQSAFF